MSSHTYSKITVENILGAKTFPEKASPKSITFWYGGWSLLDLKIKRPDLFYGQNWYEKETFATEKGKPGMYTVCLLMAQSNGKTFAEQQALLPKEETVCPVAIAATAALLLFLENGRDPFQGDWSRCKEQTADGSRVVLFWHGGRLYVDYYWDGHRYDDVWLASARAS